MSRTFAAALTGALALVLTGRILVVGTLRGTEEVPAELFDSRATQGRSRLRSLRAD
jgi:hypothetical protein